MPPLMDGNVTLGQSIPPDTPHAVSVSLPTWRANVGYEEGESWVVDKMTTGYPRFFVHRSIQRLAKKIAADYGNPDQDAILFPSHKSALHASDYFARQSTSPHHQTRILQFIADPAHPLYTSLRVMPRISAVLYPKDMARTAKEIWQHTGLGVSSRRSEYCETCIQEGVLVEKSSLSDLSRAKKGPRRYQKNLSTPTSPRVSEFQDADQTASSGFVEERYGRNLDVAVAQQAKTAVRQRLAGLLPLQKGADVANGYNLIVENGRDEDNRPPNTLPAEDVYLFSGGMAAIYTAHHVITAYKPNLPCVMYGFPYVDTLKILQKWGVGAQFYGHGTEQDLDDLEQRLKHGERFPALFCEFPGNPMLRSPNLKRIRALADQYDFVVVVDETIGNFLNVHVMPYADIVVSSLTKIFSGDCNVMAGCAVLNPAGPHYDALKQLMEQEYEDNFFEEDAVFLERNSRDSVSRVARINTNAKVIVDLLQAHPAVKKVYYPELCETRANYDDCRLPTGGYGGLLSAMFQSVDHSAAFYDALDTAKGPSLGTNFTLSSPYVMLAHYTELDWVKQFGLDASLIRFSVGLEDPDELIKTFQRALDAVPA